MDLSGKESAGLKFLMVPKALVKEAGISPDDYVQISFRVIDQDKVSVPAELQEALEQNSDAKWMWDGLTPGQRRGYAYRVSSAKRESTRRRRAADIVAELGED